MKIKYTSIIEQEFVDELDLDPNDFLNCQTVWMLKSEIDSWFKKRDGRYVSKKLDIPKEFIDEWKKLVGFIPDNVMTYTRKERLLRNSEELYVETYTGNELNHLKNTWSWNTFHLGDYSDFRFIDDKHYKCYLVDNDRYDHVSTSIVYAERVD